MTTIGIIDYGSGNFGSVWNAIELLTNDIIRVTAAKDLSRCTHIVLPGVGAFVSAMNGLQSMNIIPELIDRIYIRQVPFLGICVGMQILGSWGEEFEPCQGLGWVQGISRKIDVDTRDFPLPHVGWNTITVHHELPLFKRMDEDAAFYFVHSYHLACTDREVKQAFCHYGVPVLAALSKRNIHGVQFHPEKSQESGLKVLSNFISL